MQPEEHSFLREMLYAAIHVPQGLRPPPKTIIDDPAIHKYIANWGSKLHDIAFVAEQNGDLIGAIWCRLLKYEEKGYGYIDDNTPELSIAIKKTHRNLGLGTQLLNKSFHALSGKGFQQVSLSVDQDNKAVNLYKRLGFEIVEEVGTAYTMKKIL